MDEKGGISQFNFSERLASGGSQLALFMGFANKHKSTDLRKFGMFSVH